QRACEAIDRVGARVSEIAPDKSDESWHIVTECDWSHPHEIILIAEEALTVAQFYFFEGQTKIAPAGRLLIERIVDVDFRGGWQVHSGCSVASSGGFQHQIIAMDHFIVIRVRFEKGGELGGFVTLDEVEFGFGVVDQAAGEGGVLL